MSFKNDYINGIKNEDIVYNFLINKYPDENIKKVESRYEKYDFIGLNYIYELKSRNNNYNTYPTTLIALDKIIKKNKKKQIFIFKFLDGIYYIEYDEKKFNNYDKKYFKRNQRNDFNDIEKIYIYIPIKDLIKYDI
jgi:hypothetical protein